LSWFRSFHIIDVAVVGIVFNLGSIPVVLHYGDLYSAIWSTHFLTLPIVFKNIIHVVHVA